MAQLAASAVLICWLVNSSLWIYPHSLSYFNESTGGPLNASKHLLGSNVDWGQDLRYAIWFLESREGSNQSKLSLAYAGFFDPAVVGLNRVLPLNADDLATVSGKRSLILRSIGDETLFFLDRPSLISVNLLFGAKQPIQDGSLGRNQLPEKRNAAFKEITIRVVKRIGYSMLLLR